MCGGGGGGWIEVKSRTSLKIDFLYFFFTIIFRNHSYLDHRHSIKFGLFLRHQSLGSMPWVGLEVKI